MKKTRDADWLAVAEARERILSAVPVLGSERTPIMDCLGFVLAEDVISPIELPPHDNSAMDGFAVRAADVRGATAGEPRVLPVVGDVAAGGALPGPLPPGAALRVMTGAPVPPGADSVVRVEHTDGGEIGATGGGHVRVHSDADAGQNVRPRGEDLRVGDRVLQRGAVLRAAELGIAASVGRAELPVVRRPVVAVLTSGDELVDLSGFDEVLTGRRIVSSNSYTLAAQLREIGCEVHDLGIAPDDPGRMREMLDGAVGADALITSAGISMGDRDLVRGVLADRGCEIDFWRVRMKPGSPFAFGHLTGLGGIPWFGLPGNPVSSMVTFEILVRPALLRMSGRSAVFAPTVTAAVRGRRPCSERLTDFLRVRLVGTDDEPVAELTGAQGSGILTSMAAADALLAVPEGTAEIATGDSFPALVLGGAPLRESPGY